MPQVKPLLFQIDYVSPAIPAPPARRSNGAAGGWMSNIGRAIRTNAGREHSGNTRGLRVASVLHGIAGSGCKPL
jgi:hypothetical protein